LEQTGCDAVMVASALLYNPYLFDSDAAHFGGDSNSGTSANSTGLSPADYNPIKAA
jgi:tRNA-dihydrouridine synthase